ncbi:MAG TPA: S8 family serine peptidase [Solirubrobacteraceae bacterium]|nr:S8 family serine peptidase [Solirubrobacteraceae bacterium]
MSSRSRFRLVALLATAVLVPLTAGGIALAAHVTHLRAKHHRVQRHAFHGARPLLGAAQVKRLSAKADRRSIIIFKNQLGRLPATRSDTRARVSAALAAQAGVRAELTQLHASNVRSFSLINAMSATVSAAEVTHLEANPAVQAVVPDATRHFASLGSGPGPALGAMAGVSSHATSTGPQQICPADPTKPIIEPEARDVMNVTAAEQLADGSGVKVGILADGIDPSNPDLIRANGDHVIFDYRDFSGFGTNAATDGREAFLDAGTIASQGNQTYDLSGFVNPAHPLLPGCNIKIDGIAPGASLAVMNLQGSAGGFSDATILAAIQWAVEQDHVNILNESIGGNPIPNTEDDPVALADQAAVAAGVTVVASSGDSGPFNNIGSPATTPGVIDVGGTTTYRVYRQTTRYGTQLSNPSVGWEDNNITALSSDGFTQFNPATVSVVAPGDRGWSLCSSDTAHFQGCVDIDKGSDPPPIWAAGGTSASAPETSGTAALVINAYEKTHGGNAPSPELVKQIIVSTAQDLGAPADRQGAGLVDTLKAVQQAETINGGSQPQGNSLFVRQTSLSATVTAGQTPRFDVNVTNAGTSPQTVTPSIIGAPQQTSDDTGSVNLSSASPTFVDGEGNTDSFQKETFTVPANADYLTGDITWTALSTGGAVYETLFNPQGQVAAYSLLGTNQSGFGHVEVRQPMAGPWTAVIFTLDTPGAEYSGPVQFGYSTQQFHNAGSVFPASRTLRPGQSSDFRVSVPSGQAGDESFRLHLGTGSTPTPTPTSTPDGSIPIIVRSLVPMSRQGGGFSGNLSGGADSGLSGQTFSYQFQVPWGRPSLNLAVELADVNYDLQGWLVDPNGQPVDVQDTTQRLTPSGATPEEVISGRTMQFLHEHPQGGLWTVVLTVVLPVNGAQLSEPYSGAISFNPPPISSTGIPNSRRHRVRPGQPVTATINVTNNGNIPKDYLADVRLDRRVPQLLAGDNTNNVALPLAVTPNWLVPPGTNGLATVAQATLPVTMDTRFVFGDPDFSGPSFGNVTVNREFAPEIAPGLFLATPSPTNPDGADGVPAGTSANLAALANTFPFDSNVTTSTGDIWALSVNRNAPPYTPLTLNPGQSGAITVTFTPSGHRGHTVDGFIGVDTFNEFTDSGDEVATIPYRYRVR